MIHLTPTLRTAALRAVCAATCALLIPTFAAADSVISFDVNARGARHASHIFVDRGVVAMTQDNTQGHMFFDTATNTMTVVDHAAKTYTVMDEAKIERAIGMASGVVGAMAAALGQLNNLPADQRKAAEDLLKGMGVNTAAPVVRKLVPTDNRRNINGVVCMMYDVQVEQQTISQACVASRKDSGVADEDWKAINSMRALWLKYADQAGPMLERFGAGVPELTSLGVDGLPVLVVTGDKPEMMIRKVSRGKAPAWMLGIPDGYAEKSLPLL